MEKSRLDIPLTEKLKSIPGYFGIHFDEQPKYTVLKEEKRQNQKNGDYELEFREYRPLFVVKTTVVGDYKNAKEEAFKKLASYFFQHEIPMTTPVFFENHGQAVTMSLVLPSSLKLQSLAMPEDPTIQLQELPVQTWAVIRYSGKNEINEIEEKTNLLKTWLESSRYPIETQSLRVAQYDGPNTISFLRTNEVQVRLWSGDLTSTI